MLHLASLQLNLTSRSPEGFNSSSNSFPINRCRRKLQVFFVLADRVAHPSELLIEHAQAAMTHRNRIVQLQGAQIQPFSLLLVRFPVLLSGVGRQQFALFLL